MLGWDSLVCDIHNNIFRQKLSYYYTPKTTLVKSGKLNIKDTTKLASIERIPPSISAKTPKEVNEIFKFFYHKMNYSLICDIWTLDALSKV